MREISANTRSNIGYGVLSVLMIEMDDSKGVDDLIYELHSDKAQTKWEGLSSTEAADMAESILSAVIFELEHENNEDTITDSDLINAFANFVTGSEEDLCNSAETFLKYLKKEGASWVFECLKDEEDEEEEYPF